jgi:hypothetical protein
MQSNYRVCATGPEGAYELGEFELLCNAQCFMFAWSGVPYPMEDNHVDLIRSCENSFGQTCYVEDLNDYFTLDDCVFDEGDGYKVRDF